MAFSTRTCDACATSNRCHRAGRVSTRFAVRRCDRFKMALRFAGMPVVKRAVLAALWHQGNARFREETMLKRALTILTVAAAVAASHHAVQAADSLKVAISQRG